MVNPRKELQWRLDEPQTLNPTQVRQGREGEVRQEGQGPGPSCLVFWPLQVSTQRLQYPFNKEYHSRNNIG